MSIQSCGQTFLACAAVNIVAKHSKSTQESYIFLFLQANDSTMIITSTKRRQLSLLLLCVGVCEC